MPSGYSLKQSLDLAEGQGTVRFLQAGGQKQMKQVFRAAKTPSCFVLGFFFE